MLRVDVPAVGDVPGFTKFYGGGAVYAVTPTDEASALHAVGHLTQRPIDRWVIPERQLLARGEVSAEEVQRDRYDEEEPPF